MEDLLQQNLMYLFHHHKDTFNKIQRYMNNHQEKNCKIVFNDEGSVNLSYATQDGIKLLYSEDRIEVQQWLKKHSFLQDGYYDVIMLGLGLSHHLSELIRINPNLNFYIYEPEIDIFLEALKVLQIDELLQHPQVKIFALGDDDDDMIVFYELLHTYSEYAKIDVFIPFYAEINLELIRRYYKFNYSVREVKTIELSFEKIFGTLPYRNSIMNLEKLYLSCSLRLLKNRYAGCTVLIVGAGPSLEIDIESIKSNREKYLIISAGSSVQSLLHYGIEPHLSVSMDPGKANGKVFEGKNVENLSLVYVPQIYSGIVQQNFKQKFYAFFNTDPITEYILYDMDSQLKFTANNSVTGTAIQVAVYLGATDIIFAGQDLSFPNNQYYAPGAKHASDSYLKERIQDSFLEVENVKGTMNSTNRSIKSVLEDIERLIEQTQGVKFINTSSLGAKIKGTEYVPFNEAVSDLKSSYNFEQLRSITDSEGTIHEFEVDVIIHRVNEVIKICDNLSDASNTSLLLIKKIDELSRTNPNKAVNSLAKLEQEFSKVTEHPFYRMVIVAWCRGLTKAYDKDVIKIEAEPTMIGKSKLLNEIVLPYIQAISNSLAEIKKEFQSVYEKLEFTRKHDYRK